MALETKLGLAMRFFVKIDGWDLGGWSKVEGLTVTWDVCEYRAGDAGNDRWYYPGATDYPNIKLSRAAAAEDTTKVKGWLSSNSFKSELRTGEIELRDSENKGVATWDLRDVMPVKWSIVPFDATATKVAIETLELVHMGFLEDELG